MSVLCVVMLTDMCTQRRRRCRREATRSVTNGEETVKMCVHHAERAAVLFGASWKDIDG